MKFIISQKGKQLAVPDGYFYRGGRNLNTEAKRCFATHDEDIDYFNMRIYIILIACVYIQQFNFVQKRPYGTVVNTYAVQSGGCRFESLWGFGFF